MASVTLTSSISSGAGGIASRVSRAEATRSLVNGFFVVDCIPVLRFVVGRNCTELSVHRTEIRPTIERQPDLSRPDYPKSRRQDKRPDTRAAYLGENKRVILIRADRASYHAARIIASLFGFSRI